jgi:hypothetical protein
MNRISATHTNRPLSHPIKPVTHGTVIASTHKEIPPTHHTYIPKVDPTPAVVTPPASNHIIQKAPQPSYHYTHYQPRHFGAMNHGHHHHNHHENMRMSLKFNILSGISMYVSIAAGDNHKKSNHLGCC